MGGPQKISVVLGARVVLGVQEDQSCFGGLKMTNLLRGFKRTGVIWGFMRTVIVFGPTREPVSFLALKRLLLYILGIFVIS